MTSPREVQELSGQLNHDLREPINSIVRKLELLRSSRIDGQGLPPKGEELIELMSNHCAVLLQRIRGLRNEALHTSMSERAFLDGLSPILREAAAMVAHAGQIHRYWDDPSEAQERYLGQVRGTAVRFQKMLRALLSVAAMSDPVFEPTNYRNQALTASVYILESLREARSPLAEQGVFYWRDNKASGWADQGMFLTIFQNLYENCVKYRHPSRHFQIWTFFSEQTAEEVAKTGLVPESMLSKKAEDYIRITVRDNGIGIPKTGLRRIFDPYVQLNAGRRRVGKEVNPLAVGEDKDVGIGLYTVRKMVAAHHGYVAIESDGSTGSSFHLFVPKDPRVAGEEFSPVI